MFKQASKTTLGVSKALSFILIPCLWLAILFLWISPAPLSAQTNTVPSGTEEESDTVPDGTEGEILVKKESPKKPWNEFDLGFTTFKFGAGFLYEYGSFSQDEEGKQQSEIGGYRLDPTDKIRDFRILFSGQIPTDRTITWKTGIMYDAPSSEWFVRETGVMIAVPELWGNIFIGRTKEGTSMNKVMNGYAGWGLERQIALDVIPILADGFKWLGYLPKQRFLWNAGAYGDAVSKGQTFSTFQWQLATRLVWLPIYSTKEKTVLHLGTSIRYAKPVDGKIRLRSRPEANTAPYFIDTGTFASDHSTSLGFEAYYSKESLMIGSEYYLHNFSSDENDDPLFKGGEAVVSYILTGESRPYSTVSGIYAFVPVAKPVWKGGPGAIEALVRVSNLDLDGGTINGGKFWRITPMVNWYLSSMVRIEVAYGYGTLDRYNLKGHTHIFQSRIQFLVM